MPTLSGATSAAASATRGRHAAFYPPLLLAAITLVLSGCMPVTTSSAGADPADPAARAAPVSYHSTVAPYASLRPIAPSPWRDRNDAVAPQPKQDR